MLLATVLDAESFRSKLFEASPGWAPMVEERVDELRRAHIWITYGEMRKALFSELRQIIDDETVDEDIRIRLDVLIGKLEKVCFCNIRIADVDKNKSRNNITSELPKTTGAALDLLKATSNIDLMFTSPEYRQLICSSEAVIAEKVHDFWTYQTSKPYRIEKASREIVNFANERPYDAHKLLSRFIQWSQDVVVVDRYIAEAAWYNNSNWKKFKDVITMLFEMWKNRAANNESDEGQFRIISVIPKPKDNRSPYPNAFEVRDKLQSKLKNDAIEIEIREVSRRLKHDRYLVVHDGEFVVSSSTGFDFSLGANDPCEVGFRRMRQNDVVNKILQCKLLTERSVASTPRPVASKQRPEDRMSEAFDEMFSS